MTSEPNTKVTATQKNDDGRWYYVITVDQEEGNKVGPYDSQEAAIAAGEQKLAESSSV